MSEAENDEMARIGSEYSRRLETDSDDVQQAVNSARRAFNNNDWPTQKIKQEDFEVTDPLIRGVLWSGVAGATETGPRDADDNIIDLEMCEAIALGGMDGPRLDPDAGRGYVTIWITISKDDWSVLDVFVASSEQEADPDHRPELCECTADSLMPCEYCFIEGFNTPNN